MPKEYKEYMADIKLVCTAHNVKPLEGRLRFTMKAYRPRKTGDLLNLPKLICDALNGAAYLDDEQIIEAHCYRYDDKDDPRIELIIEELL